VKWSFLSTILLLLCSSAAFGEEYEILVKGVGYEDVPVSEKVPEETVLYSTEVIASPNQTFHNRTRLGPETLTMEGKLIPEADGSFSLQIKYGREIDTGFRIPTADGTREPVLNVTSTECSITIEFEKQVLFGGFETGAEADAAGEATDVQSKLHHVLVVTQTQPEQN
jgi:hypothetical protein